MDINLIKKLREMSGASLKDCTSSLEEASGDMDKALDLLRHKGQAIALKKSTRETNAGLIKSYIHSNGRVGVLLDLRCETDFVAKNELFSELAHELALQVAAMNPQYVNADEVDVDYLKKEKSAYLEQLKDSGKPADIIEKIVEGKIQKQLADITLLGQSSVKDPSKTIKQLIAEYIGKIGENIKVAKFVRYEI